MDPETQDVGDLLVEAGQLTSQQLEQVRRHQARTGKSLHKTVVELNLATEEDTYRALARFNHLDYVDLTQLEIPPPVLEAVPVKLIFHYRMIPLALDGDLLTVALSEPLKQLEQGNLRLLLNKRLKMAISSPSAIHAVLKQRFGLGAATIEKLREEKGAGAASEEIIFDVKTSTETTQMVDPTIADFVDQILLEALRLQATDIHIEPYGSSIRLRYRIDGLMQTIPVPAGLRQFYATVVSRLKIMAGLDIAERRLPQDGRIAMKRENEEYDLRVSVIPSKHGEAICLRILGRQGLFRDMTQLGMEPDQEAMFAELTQLSQGMVLITGPTGSGKTTTLYAALAHANDESRKVITIEDPVEYRLEGVQQIQMHEDIGLTFSEGLRAVLRHDPDVVLIGEIRDRETAEIAVRAAQTGHLVFSTLHTNDSVSAVTRLMDMRIDPFLIGSSLVCSIAQRLARRVCRHCRAPDPNIPARIRREMARYLKLPPEQVQAFKGRGCVECNQQGCRGRIALYEFFLVTDEIADLIEPAVKTSQLRETGRRYGWHSLREQGWLKVQRGIIPLSEQQRLTHKIMVPELSAAESA
jgi:type II secretory ATPase GspE/PulE/Tfp pilus assembly ATPase PilB-like protein